MKELVRVTVADPHPVVRLGVRCVLADTPDLRVVGDGPCAHTLAADLDPDVMLVGGPLAEAVEAVVGLLASRPGRRTVILSACDEAAAVRQALTAGASGYVLKRSAADELVRAVRAVATGGTYVDSAVSADAADGLGGLSEREGHVLAHLAWGYSNKEIAARLGVSVKTVETYKARLLARLGLRSRVDLVRYAVRRGWMTHPRAVGTPRRAGEGGSTE